MLAIRLSHDVLFSAGYRIVILLLVLIVAVRVRKRYHWPVGAAVFFGLVSNACFFVGNLSLSGLFGIPYIGMAGWVMIDYMRHDITALRALMGRKETEWSRERHDLRNELAAKEAELYTLRKYDMPNRVSALEDRAGNTEYRADVAKARADVAEGVALEQEHRNDDTPGHA